MFLNPEFCSLARIGLKLTIPVTRATDARITDMCHMSSSLFSKDWFIWSTHRIMGTEGLSRLGSLPSKGAPVKRELLCNSYWSRRFGSELTAQSWGSMCSRAPKESILPSRGQSQPHTHSSNLWWDNLVIFHFTKIISDNASSKNGTQTYNTCS